MIINFTFQQFRRHYWKRNYIIIILVYKHKVMSEKVDNKNLGIISSALSGTTGGALIGSTFGIVGSIVGGIVGGFVTGYSGYRNEEDKMVIKKSKT